MMGRCSQRKKKLLGRHSSGGAYAYDFRYWINITATILNVVVSFFFFFFKLLRNSYCEKEIELTH